MSKLCVAMLVGLLGPAAALAFGPADRDVVELVAGSSAIVVARVVRVAGACESNVCGTNYGLLVESVHKGDVVESKRLTVCSYASLELGSHYTLFLGPAVPDINGRLSCALTVWHDGVFTWPGPRVYRHGSPDSSTVLAEHGKVYRTNGVVFESFDEKLREAIRQPSD